MDYTDSITLESQTRAVKLRVQSSMEEPDKINLRDAVKAVLQEIGTKHADLRKSIYAFMNTFSSVRDELNQGILSSFEAKTTVKEGLKKFNESVDTYIKATLDSRANASAEDIPRQLTSYSMVKHEILSAIQSKHVWIGNAPVIPQFKQPKYTEVKRTGGPAQPMDVIKGLSLTALTKAGVPCTSLGGYAVLTKEKILVVPRDYIREKMKDPGKPSDEWTSRTEKEQESLFEEVLHAALAKNPRHEALEVASAWKGARCYWLITKGELAILRKAAGGMFAVQRWSFAFGD